MSQLHLGNSEFINYLIISRLRETKVKKSSTGSINTQAFPTVYYHQALGASALIASRSNSNESAQPSKPYVCPSLSNKRASAFPPRPLDLKAIKQIVTKTEQRLDLLKQDKFVRDRSGDSTLKLLRHLSLGDLLGQDRLDEYCLKKSHKCIQMHQKASSKSLNEKLFQLKK